MNIYQWFLQNNYGGSCLVVISSDSGSAQYSMPPGAIIQVPLHDGYKIVATYDPSGTLAGYYPIYVDAQGRYFAALLYYDGTDWKGGSPPSGMPYAPPGGACHGKQQPIP